MTEVHKSKLDEILNYHKHMPSIEWTQEEKTPTLPTTTEIEKHAELLHEPGKEKLTFLRMVKKESLEYIIDIFYQSRSLSKESFIELVLSTTKNAGPNNRLIAEKYFESIDLWE